MKHGLNTDDVVNSEFADARIARDIARARGMLVDWLGAGGGVGSHAVRV